MAHRTVYSLLLPKVLAAIGAGSLLGTTACGGKSSTPSGNSPNELEEHSSSEGATSTAHSQSGASSDLGVTQTTAPTAVESSSTSDEVASSEVACEFGTSTQFCLNVAQMENQARFGVGQIPLDPPRSDEQIAAAWDENGCMKFDWVATSCCNPAQGPGQPQPDGSCCYVACEGACCGRPFLVNGTALVAGTTSGDAWTSSEVARDSSLDALVRAARGLGEHARRKLSDAWIADAQMEHASIASFAQFSLDLLRLGAPPELLRECHLAALDEIEHARIAFTVAEQLSCVAVGPDVLPIGDLQLHTIEQAVAAAVIEGCIGETIAAAILSEQAHQCSEAGLARLLTKMAEDELRHAQLAWRFVAWSIQRYGRDVRVTVAATFDSALGKLPAPTDLGLPDQALRVGGRITSTDWVRVVEGVVTNVLRPAVATLQRLQTEDEGGSSRALVMPANASARLT